MEATFTPLHPGTIASIPEAHRAIVVPKAPSFDPLGLPAIPTQCAHIDVDWDGTVLGRCLDDANRMGRQGFLCSRHADRLGVVVVKVPRLGLDAEILDGIIRGDKRAIERGKRVDVRWGRLRLSYLEAV